MAELRQRHTRGGATRMAAYLRHDCGRCKVETAEKGEVELRARPIGEWGGGERGRARRSSCDGNGVAGARRLRCGEEKPRRSKNGARMGAGERWRVEGALRPALAALGRAPATRGRFPRHTARGV